MKFAKRILKWLPFVQPMHRAAGYAAEAAPVAFSRVGLPHTMLFVLVFFAGLLEGHQAAAAAAIIAAGAELFILAPKFMSGTNERRMAYHFAGIHGFVLLAIILGMV